MRRSYDRLISTLGFLILGRCNLYIELGPWISKWQSYRCKSLMNPDDYIYDSCCAFIIFFVLSFWLIFPYLCGLLIWTWSNISNHTSSFCSKQHYNRSSVTNHDYPSNLYYKRHQIPTQVCLVPSCNCLCPMHWSQVLSREWRRSLSSADRVINSVIAYEGCASIRSCRVHHITLLLSVQNFDLIGSLTT